MSLDEQNLRVQDLLNFPRRLNNLIENITRLLGVTSTRYYQILPNGKFLFHQLFQEVPSKSRRCRFFLVPGKS